MSDKISPKISVIIPVYNAEKTLERCLSSVLSQTLKDIEVICVDDGSRDDSARILEKYRKLDERVVILCQENKGPMSARKLGLSVANAECVTFADSDDYVDSHMYEKMYELLSANNVDIVTSAFYVEGNYVSVQSDGIAEGTYTGERKKYLLNNAIYIVDEYKMGISGSLWSKLFKTSILREVFLKLSDDLTFSEDKICVLRYLLECDSVYVSKQAYYHYVMSKDSLTHRLDTDYLTKVNEVYKSFVEMYDHPNFTDSMRQQAELYITEMLYKGINSRLGFANRNLLWIDPYWMEEFSKGTKFALYGAGELGSAYYNQIQNQGDFTFAGCVDFGYERLSADKLAPKNPELLSQWDYDYVLITIKNKIKAEEVRCQLIEIGIPENKIKWFDQTEIFWKFAKYNWKQL